MPRGRRVRREDLPHLRRAAASGLFAHADRHDPAVRSRRSDTTDKLDQQIADADQPFSSIGRPSPPTVKLELGDLHEQVQLARERFDQSLQQHAGVIDAAAEGEGLPVDDTRQMLSTCRQLIDADPSVAPLMLQLQADGDEYLYNHGMNVALLMMSLAARLGYDTQRVLDIGIGSLFADVGMTRVPREVRMSPRKLNADQWLAIKMHPVHTADLLDDASVDSLSMIIAYQAHERCDGSGYPQARRHEQIHPLAGLLAAVDMFIAVTSPRPYRNPISSYDAMVLLLYEVRNGRLDAAAVRALLDCVALFPVGSFVKLSDERVARVMRAGGRQHTRPVVEPIESDGTPTGVELDLAREDELQVIAAIGPDDALNQAA